MGDRVSFGFKMEDDVILYLYQHWGGWRHQRRLAEALDAATSRLSDPSYATRITISQLIGDDWDSSTGHGLYINTCDSEYDVHVVDFNNKTVSLHKVYYQAPRGIYEEPIQTWSIQEFVESELSKVLTEV